MRAQSRSTVVVLGLATLIQGAVVAVAFFKAGAVDAFAFRSLDSREYYAIAANLVDHGAFSQDEKSPYRPDTWRTPGYPLFLAACMFLVGESPAALVLVQQLLCILNVLLVFRIACRWMPDRRATLAASLFALEPYHLYYSLWVMSTTLLTTLVLAAWLFWPHGPRRMTSWTACTLGGLCGLAVLTWPGAMLVPVFMLAGVMVLAWTSQPHRWVNVPTFLVVCLFVIGSWIVRNVHVAGRVALSHQSGIVLAYFKAAEVVLWREGRTADRYLETSLDPHRAADPHVVWEDIDRRLRERFPAQPDLAWSTLAQGNRTSADSFEVSAYLSRIACEMLSESPLRTVACYMTRCAQLLTFPLDLAVAPPRGIETNRARSAVVGSAYGLLVVMVVVRLFRRRASIAALYFPLATTLALLLAATPQTDPRFRVAMIPMLLFVALCPATKATAARRDPRADRRA